jgi:hypothetical protein
LPPAKEKRNRKKEKRKRQKTTPSVVRDDGRRFCMRRRSLYLDIIHPMGQNKVDELVAGMVGLGGQFVQLGQNLLSNTDRDDAIPVLATPFNDKRFIVHMSYLAISLYIIIC